MSLEFRHDGMVGGFTMWYRPDSISLEWNQRTERGWDRCDDYYFDRHYRGNIDDAGGGAEEWGDEDEKFAADWIKQWYEEDSLEPGKIYFQEVEVDLKCLVELGIFDLGGDDELLGHFYGDDAVAVPVLAAVWAINRRAKRCRDLASNRYEEGDHDSAQMYSQQKARLYELKEQALHYLLAEGRLAHAGYHQFSGGNWAEVLKGDGFTFHRPCPDREEGEGELLEGIEAKPKEAEEPRVKDALHTVKSYLEGKPEVEVYSWPAKVKASRQQWDHEDYEDDDEDYDDE